MAELRLMTKQDIDECTELYMKAFPKEGKLEEYFREWALKYFEEYIVDDRCFACVFEEADTIIGLITAIVIPSIGDDSTHIDTVAIDPDYQHRGYGTQMLNEFIKFSGVRIFTLTTMRDSNGYKLYSKLGFEDEKESACMIMIPGVTDELMRYRAKLEGELSE